MHGESPAYFHFRKLSGARALPRTTRFPAGSWFGQKTFGNIRPTFIHAADGGYGNWGAHRLRGPRDLPDVWRSREHAAYDAGRELLALHAGRRHLLARGRVLRGGSAQSQQW